MDSIELAKHLQWIAMAQRGFPGWASPPTPELLWKWVGPEQQVFMIRQAQAALAWVASHG